MNGGNFTGPAYTVLIPARLASTRLPNKPLADIHNLPMVVRVAQRAAQSHASRVVVAADSQDILDACQVHGVEAILTGTHHPSGSDRLAEASTLLGLSDADIVVNVQGDEPLIDPDLIDSVASLLAVREDCAMSTAAHAIETWTDFISPNVVKVVLDARHTAMYFSRAPIPVARDQSSEAWWDPTSDTGSAPPLRHVGIYGYRAGFLRSFPQLPQAGVEQLEALEQLRALWHGYRIAVHVTAKAPGGGVDTAEDLERVRHMLQTQG